MHVQTLLLHSEGDVRAHHRQELKRAHQTSVRRRVVRDQSFGAKLALGINWRRSWLAASHPSAVEDVLRVPRSREVDAR